MLHYPDSKRLDIVEQLHGTAVADPYRWLEDLDSAETRAWIAAQNALTEGYLCQVPSRDRIRQRLEALWNYDQYGVPFKRGGRYFMTWKRGLQNQGVLYWMPALDAEPRVLLDPNGLSEDGTVALVGVAVSDDGRYLAYGLSSAGSDWQEWRVRDVESGADLEDCLQWVKFSGASWTSDSRGFFYSRYDAPAAGDEYRGLNYYQRLCYHRLGTLQADDELVYERPDQKEWGFDGHVTEDGRYLVVTVWQGTRVENGAFYKDLHAPGACVVELLDAFDARYEFVGNDGPLFYFLTDQDAPMGRVVAVDLERPEPAQWREVIAESTDVLRGASLIGDHLVAVYLHDAQSAVQVLDKTGQFVRQVVVPGIGSVSGFEGRADDPETFFAFTSFSTPGTIYRYEVGADACELFRAPEVGFEPEEYLIEQVFYKSADGTRVPMFLSYRRGLQINEQTPVLLHGYGGFDVPLTPSFLVPPLVWMEMGGIYGQANLRGGGEYGAAWHQAGMKLQKQNVFDDFVAAAEWLIANGYTSPARLTIVGGSNGGLAVGACLTQRPDLYGACLVIVGVLDMLRFHKFTIGWAWTSDYGSPDDPDEFRALLAYSPYHNVRPSTPYPATLMTTADHDDRVYPAHSLKFAAALQAAQGGDAPILIRIETRAGHGMYSPTAKQIEEAADGLAFQAWALGWEV